MHVVSPDSAVWEFENFPTVEPCPTDSEDDEGSHDCLCYPHPLVRITELRLDWNNIE